MEYLIDDEKIINMFLVEFGKEAGEFAKLLVDSIHEAYQKGVEDGKKIMEQTIS